MPDRIDELEAKVAGLSAALERVEARLAAVEARKPAARPRRADARAVSAGDVVRTEEVAFTSSLSLIGRTLLVLAGAFVLRALTDSGTLPAAAGVAAGFAYAGTWVALADRAGRAGRAWSAGYHGASAVLIGFPLLFEATTRFRLLSPAIASALLTAFTAGALAVAARRRMQGIAWLVALGGIATAVALAAMTNRIVPPVVYLVALGVATLWLGYVRDWHELRWPVALAADLAAALVALRAVAPGATEGPAISVAVLVLLMAGYLGSFAARTLGLGREVVPFEIAQTAGVTAAGLGGAAFVAARSGTAAIGLGPAAAALGLGAYAVAFTFVQRRQKRTANFYFYGSVGLVYVLAGTGLALDAALPLAWAGLAIVAAALARRERSRMLTAHSAVYGVAAAIASGLVAHATEAAFGSPFEPWTPAGGAALAVLAAMGTAAALTAHAVERRRAIERIPQVLAMAALAWGAAGLVIGWVVPLVAGAAGPEADAGRVAVVRTAVLVAGTLVVACIGRCQRYLEAAWLAWPLLVVVGLKILVEDLPRGRPATLFPAFALYGIALILVPRLRIRRAREPATAHVA